MKNYRYILIWLCLALSLRLVALFTVDSISHPQVWEYETIANNFLEGKGLYYTFSGAEYRNTTMVLYPLVTAAVYYFTNHSFLAVKIFQIILSLFTCLLVYLIAQKLFSKRGVSLFALVLLSFHPGLIVYSVKLHPLTSEAFLLSLSIFLLLSAMEVNSKLRNYFFAGLTLGLILLIRATVGIFILMTLFVIYYKLRNHLSLALRSISTLLLGISLIVMPLFLRNYFIFKKIVILPSDSGFNFWIGNNQISNGTAGALDGKSIFYSTERDFQNKVNGMNEFEQRKFFYNDAFNFIKNNKVKSFTLFLKKLYYFWWFSPTQGYIYPVLWMLAYKLYYSLLIFLAVSSFFVIPETIFMKKREAICLILFCFITMSFAQALYYVDGRHRWIIEPIILIFSSYGFVFFFKRLKEKYGF